MSRYLVKNLSRRIYSWVRFRRMDNIAMVIGQFHCINRVDLLFLQISRFQHIYEPLDWVKNIHIFHEPHVLYLIRRYLNTK